VSAGRRRFAAGLVVATLFLIFAGAEVKSRQAGLSVPDWPLSYGMWWPPMVGNVFYEHGHRTIAAGVGLLTVILALWTARSEARAGVRRLLWWMVFAVCLQGALGGITVLWFLPPAVSIGHGLLAQSFACLTALSAYLVSREWQRLQRGGEQLAGDAAHPTLPLPRGGAAAAHSAQRTAVAATALVAVQLLLGLVVRHTESGLAVPFFPVSEAGAWLPAEVDGHVAVHMAHRGFALVVVAGVLLAAWRASRVWAHLTGHAVLAGAVVLLQVLLGARVIWTARVSQTDGITPVVDPVPASLHVLVGATLLVGIFLLALRTWSAARAVSTAAAAPRVAATPGRQLVSGARP